MNQAKTPKPLKTAHHPGIKVGGIAFVLTILFLPLNTAPAQTPPQQRPQVEVAAIHLSPPGGGELGNIHLAPGRFEAHNMPVRKLIYIAYKVKADRILGGPAWLNSETYDITATAEDMTGNNFPLMLQTLLEDRFKLKMHPETREAPVYDLIVAKGGAKLQLSRPESCTPFTLSKSRPAQSPGQRWCGWHDNRSGIRAGTGITLADQPGVGFQGLSGQLSLILDKPVLDHTNLTGRYDVHLEWTPDETSANAPGDTIRPGPAPDSAPTIFTAVREQLGLELKPAKGPVTVLVIDGVERPSEN